MKRVVTILFVSILLAACGAGTPKGTDADVKDLVMEITTDELRRQITPIIYQKVTNVPVGLIGIKVTYESLVENKGKDKNALVISEIDKAMEGFDISLKNIRVDSVDDDIQKSESSADIVINGKSSPITYTAQLNSDGDLYVEVFGL
ncbi:MAG TPA: hypothetical protein VL178_03485 [Pseudomonas sp.]|nr:hypothetical protein [Pseudomonas sp.]